MSDEYEVTISANIHSKDGLSNFSIIQRHTVDLSTFAELDELIARVRAAVKSETRREECQRFVGGNSFPPKHYSKTMSNTSQCSNTKCWCYK